MARLENASDEAPWTRHATGTLAAASEQGTPLDLGSWPPPGAIPVSTEGLYETLAAAGFAYGPSFQGLRAIWRRGDELFVEAQLPSGTADEAAGFALHPALLDAVLHGLAYESNEAAAMALP